MTDEDLSKIARRWNLGELLEDDEVPHKNDAQRHIEHLIAEIRRLKQENVDLRTSLFHARSVPRIRHPI